MKTIQLLLTGAVLAFFLFTGAVSVKTLLGWWNGDWKSPLVTAVTISIALIVVVIAQQPAPRPGCTDSERSDPVAEPGTVCDVLGICLRTDHGVLLFPFMFAGRTARKLFGTTGTLVGTICIYGESVYGTLKRDGVSKGKGGSYYESGCSRYIGEF